MKPTPAGPGASAPAADGGWDLVATPSEHTWPVASASTPLRWRGLLPGVGAAVAWLRALALPHGTIVGLSAPPDPVVAALIQAAPLAGLGLALIPHRLSAAEREHLRHAAACPLVLGIDLAPPAALDPTVAPAPGPVLEADELALVLATSGSATRPKAVALRWGAVLAAAAGAVAHLELRREDRWLACLPLDHAGGAMLVHRAAIAGCGLRLQPRFEPASVHAALAGCTGVSLVPTMLRRLLALPGKRPWPSSLRCILTGGAPLAPGLRAACAARGRAPCHSYGLSETAGLACAQDPAGETADDSGRPLPGVTLTFDHGEIHLATPAAAAGYLVAGELSVPLGSPLATGDLGAWHQGRLRVTGRRDALIISGGENVSPEAVEAVLTGHPAITAAGVAGLPDPEWGQRLEAALVLASPLADDALEGWLRTQLAPHQRPKRWCRVEALPATARGKLDRTALARLLARP